MAAYSNSTAKVLLGLFNMLTVVCGGLLLGFSLYAYMVGDATFAWKAVPGTSLIMGMVLGSLLIILGFMGFFAPRYRCTLMTYTLLLLLLMTVQLILGILIIRGTQNPEQPISSVWISLTTQQRANYQEYADCCGLMNPLDRAAPSSNCTPETITTATGCYAKLEKTYTTQTQILYVSILAYTGVEFIAICCCILMLCGCCGKHRHQDSERLDNLDPQMSSLYQ